MHLFLLQGFTTLAVHTGVHKRKRILEVACGSGLHSLYLAKTMVSKDSLFVCTDISDKMIDLAKAKFEDPDFLAVPGNRADFRAEELLPLGEKTLDVEAFHKAGERTVVGRLANNECLPFKDASFDCYLGNLSLMLVDNYRNMLKEALRVTV